MADRERDRDAAAAVPRVRHYRCAACKSKITPKVYHACIYCGLCGVQFDQAGPSKHQCEPFFDDEDEKAIAAEVERRVSAAMSAASKIRLVPL